MGDEVSNSIPFTLQDANHILEFWRDFDLEGRREPLEKQCIEMREMKTTSMNGRKHLNELTKIFRSKNKDEQLGMVTEVLKAYQEEIDQLSRRAKFSESSFYAFYKSIFEAPDPCAALDGLVSMLSSSSTNQLEIERLRSELVQYDQEFQQLKNQDITIRRLEDQLTEFRDRIEDKVAEEVARRTLEVEEAGAAKVAESRELQRAAERRLSAAVESMRQAQASADRAQTQLFEMSTQAEQRTTALLSEIAIMAEADERALSRCVELETEIETVKAQLQQAVASSSAAALAAATHSGSLASAASLAASENEAGALQALVQELRQEARRKEEAARSERARLETSMRDAAATLAREREATARFRQELGERPRREDLYAVRRQLRVLQRVVFNVQDGDGDCDGHGDLLGDDPSADPEQTNERVQLETLLTTRLKCLEAELAESRAAREESSKDSSAARAKADDLLKKLEASVALVARLESDLEASQQRPAQARSVGSTLQSHTTKSGSHVGAGVGVGAGGSGSSTFGSNSSNGGSNTNSNSNSNSNSGGVDGDFGSQELSELLGVSSGPVAQGLTLGQGQGQAGQMISILQAQRDRYKTRLAASEAQSLQLQQNVSTLTAARKQAEDDNLALYAKIRFLQSKGGGAGGADTGGFSPQAMRIRVGNGPGPSGGAVHPDSGADLEGHYQQMYEQKLNPFAEFSQRERQRRLEQLSVGDRVIFSTLSSLIAHKFGRSFLLVYIGGMHAFLTAVLWWLTHRVHHGCDPSLDSASLPSS